MEKNIIDFMKNVQIINKDLSKYYNEEKGVLFHLNTIQLLTKVELLELSAEEFKIKKFEGVVDDLEYDIIEVDRPTPKYNITKNEDDKYIITNAKVKVRQIWNVSNAAGIKKSFTNKKEAIELAEEINKSILTYFE